MTNYEQVFDRLTDRGVMFALQRCEKQGDREATIKEAARRGLTYETVSEGYRCYTGHVLTQSEADAINRANEKARSVPTEANLNGAHNLFTSIATAHLMASR